MHKQTKYSFLNVALAAVLMSACDSAPEQQDGNMKFTQGAVQSLPQTVAATSQAAPGLFRAPNPSSLNINDYSLLASFFEQECFMPDGDNYCPEGVDTSGGDSNPRKFTSYTLLGLIYHAQMYSGGLHSECDQGSAATVDATSYVALTATGSDPDKYILDYNSLLKCLYEDPSSNTTSTRYTAYSTDADGAYQATLTTRNREPYNGVTDPGQNDVFQVYVTLTDGKPSLLAFNYAGADTVFSRTVLLVNLLENKFAVKFSSYNGTGYDTVVAMGVGGVNVSTGVPNTGYYMVKFTDAGSQLERCVNNADGVIENDMVNCTSSSIATSSTWGPTSVQTYLGLSATEVTNLAAWLAKLADANALGAADTPTSAAVGGDPDLYLPRSLQSAQ